jgi:DNA polymerase-1
MELRAAAHIAEDPIMTKALADGQDLHRMTAASITGKKPEEINSNSKERQHAKAVNFGIIFGQGLKG